MPEDIPPPPARTKDPLVARLRAWGTLITAAAGLATALWKPQDQTVTKAAYAQCTEGIEKLNQGLSQEHENLATLRGYIAAKEGQSLLAPAPQTAAVDAGAPSPPAGLTPLVRKPQGGAGKPAATTAPAATVSLAEAMATAAVPAVPPPAPAPAAFHPQDFDSVLKSAK